MLPLYVIAIPGTVVALYEYERAESEGGILP